MEIPTSTRQQYSTVNKNINYSTVSSDTVLSNLSDLIPNDGYTPFYTKQLNTLGYKRFMELAGKARAGSDTPQRLFCWMLKHSEQIKWACRTRSSAASATILQQTPPIQRYTG